MSALQNLTNIVTSLVGRLNRIETNSKKTEELPSQTTLDPATLLRGSRAGVSEKLSVQQIINSIQNGNYNQLLSIGAISVVGTEITIPTGANWVINSTNYSNINDVVLEIPLSATGTNRIDILVGNASNEIILINGEETEGIAVAPPTPFDAVFITQINVTDGSIGTPADPILGTQFKKKTESLSFGDTTTTGTNAVIPFRPNGSSYYVFYNDLLESIAGFDLSLITGNANADVPYPGKDLIIANNTANPITLVHDGAAEVNFFFLDELDLVIPAGERVWLRYGGSSCELLFKSWSDAPQSDDTFSVFFQGAYLTFTTDTWRTTYQSDGFNIGGPLQTAGTGLIPTGSGWSQAGVFMIPSGFILEKAWLYIRRSDNTALPTNPHIYIERLEPLGGFEYNGTSVPNVENLINQTMSFTATNGGVALYVKDLTIANHSPKTLSGLKVGLRVTGNNMGMAPSLLLTFKKA